MNTNLSAIMSKTRSAPRTSQGGFTIIEVIIVIVVGAIVGVISLSYMGTQLIHSGDPVNISREEGAAEMWMERIISDYVQEMNGTSYTTTLATVYARDYTANPYNMPGDITLTRTYITYDAGGNEVAAAGTSTNLKVTVKAGGHALTSILTAERVTNGDSLSYY
jgi:prepilin-type N-terminal cleavage/methylation domain-containing protein